MPKPVLHNRVNKEELKKKIQASDVKRVTISFYTYHQIGNPKLFRDHLFLKFDEIGVLGRIYVAAEGINAQLSVPYANFVQFEKTLEGINFLKDIRLNIAVDDDSKSFYVLKIKNRTKIVADGIDDPNFNPSNIGKYLTAEEFNTLSADPDTVIVDMRNHYESEVGRFDNAWCPDVDTFREQIPLVVDKLNDQKNKKVIMYCTGGIRCEKASAYMKYQGFENVYHLEGGIIKYARDVRAKGLENKFKGKNFVFDERLEEKISDDIIANCHQCGTPFDHHTNCKNVACNLLFLQCPACAENMEGCCSQACVAVLHLEPETQKELRKGKDSGVRIFSKGRMTKKLVK